MQSVEPPSVQCFSIINRNWQQNLQKKEDTASLYEQVLCRICYNEESGDHQHEDSNTLRVNSIQDDAVKEIGCLQALADLSAKFAASESGMTQISHIDTDQSRIVVGEMSENYWFYANIKFSKALLNNGEVRFMERGLAMPEYLRQKIISGYNLFVLNHGTFEECERKLQKDEFREIVTEWWKVWLDHTFEFESAYSFEDDAMFKIIPGVRYSCVEKPYGFKENVDKGLKEFVGTCDGLEDVAVLNTNWTPEKNWGVIYLNEDSKYSKRCLHALINYFKDVDIKFGLSTIALTYQNWPSLKEYAEKLNPEDPSGSLIERSLMVPAIYLQNRLANNVFDPIGEAFDTLESYVPIRGVVNQVTDYVTPSISAVSDLTMKPWHSLASYWSSSGNTGDTIQINTENQSEPEEQLTATESRTQSRRSGIEIVDESLETETSTGTFLLGLKAENHIVIQEYYLENKHGEMEKVKFVIYEINGIMFLLLFNQSSAINDRFFYKTLSAKIDKIYERFFSDLIVKQVEAVKEEFSENSSFSYIIYDNEKYWTTIPNIPPNPDTLIFQNPQRKQLLEQNLNVNLSKTGDTLENYRNMSLMQDKQLQHLIKDVITNRLHPDFQGDEKLSKIGKSQWCYVKKYSANKWVLVVKRIANVEINNKNHFLGEDVSNWLDWVQAGGYDC